MRNADIVVINLKNQVGSSGQMATLTAMAFKKAIVYANNPTINHYLADNISGLMYESGNSVMLRSHLKKIMSNKSLAMGLSISAEQRYQKNYRKNIEWEKIAHFIKKVY
jgi:glycosyltransferase involved in cell wall biosynthesis